MHDARINVAIIGCGRVAGHRAEVLVLAGLLDHDGEHRGLARLQHLRHLAVAAVALGGRDRSRADLEVVGDRAGVRDRPGGGLPRHERAAAPRRSMR